MNGGQREARGRSVSAERESSAPSREMDGRSWKARMVWNQTRSRRNELRKVCTGDTNHADRHGRNENDRKHPEFHVQKSVAGSHQGRLRQQQCYPQAHYEGKEMHEARQRWSHTVARSLELQDGSRNKADQHSHEKQHGSPIRPGLAILDSVAPCAQSRLPESDRQRWVEQRQSRELRCTAELLRRASSPEIEQQSF